jgi:hypothetical protein
MWQTSDNSGPHAPRSLSHQRPRWSGKHSPAGEKSKPGSEPAQGIRELEHDARIFTSNHGRHEVLEMGLDNIVLTD